MDRLFQVFLVSPSSSGWRLPLLLHHLPVRKTKWTLSAMTHNLHHLTQRFQSHPPPTSITLHPTVPTTRPCIHCSISGGASVCHQSFEGADEYHRLVSSRFLPFGAFYRCPPNGQGWPGVAVFGGPTGHLGNVTAAPLPRMPHPPSFVVSETPRRCAQQPKTDICFFKKTIVTCFMPFA